MNRVIVGLLLLSSVNAANAAQVCEVVVCNKLERVTLDIWSLVKDQIGETCFEAVVGEEDAVVGKELGSESRWYQGSFNPTKRSVTRVKSVEGCFNLQDNETLKEGEVE